MSITTQYQEVINCLDAKMSLKFTRCPVCKVPMHKDGHEKPRWCSDKECPHRASVPRTDPNISKESKYG